MEESILTSLGFDKKAAKIYLTALSLGTASVQEIAGKADIKRPTTYLHIAELLRDGLLERVPIGKKEFYRASDPRILKDRATNILKEIERTLPQLHQLHASAKGRPGVRMLEGEKGLNEIYGLMPSANSIRFCSNLPQIEELFPKSVQMIAEAIAENAIRTREIFGDSPEIRRASKRFAAMAGKSYSSRVAKKRAIYNDTALFGNTIATFRIDRHNLFVVVIEDATIAETMKTLFDLAWESAEPFI